jgi:acyl-CoA thioesterase FadM
VVHQLDLTYHRPARLGDRLDVTVAMTGRGRARLAAVQQVLRAGELLVDARVALACLDQAEWRPARIPAALAARMEKPA